MAEVVTAPATVAVTSTATGVVAVQFVNVRLGLDSFSENTKVAVSDTT